jgi:hypothetical protein
VLPRNEDARWRGRRCRTDQVVTLGPEQETDHITTADYEIVALTVAGDFFRECGRTRG